jgi:hypothetical protein
VATIRSAHNLIQLRPFAAQLIERQMTVHMGIKGCFIGRSEYTRTLEIRCYKVSNVIPQSWLRPAIKTPALRWGFGVAMDCREIHRVGHGAYKANDCRHRHPLRTSGECIASTRGIPTVYETYEAHVQAPDLDIIYSATPHGFQNGHALLAIDGGDRRELTKTPWCSQLLK